MRCSYMTVHVLLLAIVCTRRREDVWLMKLDVEGCECHCLKSGQKLFASGKVNYVFIETDRYCITVDGTLLHQLQHTSSHP